MNDLPPYDLTPHQKKKKSQNEHVTICLNKISICDKSYISNIANSGSIPLWFGNLGYNSIFIQNLLLNSDTHFLL